MPRFCFLLPVLGLLFCACAAVRGGWPPVRPVDEKRLQELLQQSRGKVVLLNFWATWCEPCVEEFPDLTKIAREFRPRSVEVILVAIDEPEEIAKKVKPFLRAQGVTFQTYYKKTRDDEVFINTIDRNWRGAIPATFIYDANGVLIKKFIAAQSFETFTAALRSLMEK